MHAESHAYAQVAVDAAVGKRLDYAVPGALRGRLRVGSRVWVPLGARKVQGTTTSLTAELAYPKLKLHLGSERAKVSAGQSSRGSAPAICEASYHILPKALSLRRSHG